jgi:DNA-binding PadR family transcriptional regulator
MFELTGFQRDLLYITAGLNKPSGQRIKSELQEAIGPITHGRLYPNLDTLVTEGYLNKGERNRRTNFYELTDAGWEAIQDRRHWEDTYVDVDLDQRD